MDSFSFNLTHKELIFAVGIYSFLIVFTICLMYYYKKYMK